MNAAPHRRGAMRFAAPLAAALLIGLLAAITVSGHWPELRQVVVFAGKGLIASAPPEIARVEIRVGQESVALRRVHEGWSIDGTQPAPPELAAHVETGLRLLHVSEPAREIAPAELTPASFADFGLDPPASVVAVATASAPVATVNFGAFNPAGTSQYVRVGGSPAVYLMPRHVGSEWQVVGDMARRLRAQAEPALAHRGQGLFLPVSMAQVWALEIVAGGKLTRFERDGSGSWFRHTGEHSHAANANTHIADPAQARVIAAALDPLDTAAIETRVARTADGARLAQFGLSLPAVIVLLYARDNSTEMARVEFGGAADSLDRYARLAPDGEVVTIAEFEVKRLTDLLRAVGAGS